MLIPASAASADVDGRVSIGIYSHNANFCASRDYRNLGNDGIDALSHSANMQDEDKNGGPNHLRAWMKFRKIKGADLAEALGITAGMVSDLANSKRALSAKWLRRLADALHTTPGLLLDHDPQDLDRDIIEMWVNANATQRRQLKDVAQALVRTGTEG